MLVGHDWGARAAYAVAASWPERPQGPVACSVGDGTSTPKDRISYDQARAYWMRDGKMKRMEHYGTQTPST